MQNKVVSVEARLICGPVPRLGTKQVEMFICQGLGAVIQEEGAE
jgi:hypothetical protein